MRIRIFFIVAFALISLTSYSQYDTLPISPKPIYMDDLIEMKAINKQQQTFLIEFKNQYTENDRITVEEFPEYYEIIVNHPSNNKLLGGAECYKLYKKTGETKMIWHEHPEPLPEIPDALENNLQEDTIK